MWRSWAVSSYPRSSKVKMNRSILFVATVIDGQLLGLASGMALDVSNVENLGAGRWIFVTC
ncbi:hypothetical protein BO443_20720 [Burkholderia orbicola]